MAITQLSVFLENKPGRLAEAVRLLSEAKVNLRALSIADTKDFGIMRIIASETERAKEALHDYAIVTETPVVAVKMDDEAGALYHVLRVLERAQINVEYLYAFTAQSAPSAYVVLRVDDAEHAESVLKQNGVSTLSDAQLAKLL